MATASAQPPPPAVQAPSGNGDELSTHDEVKEYRHEGEGENNDQLDPMDLSDIKNELKEDAEEAETPKVTPTSTTIPVPFSSPPNTAVTPSSLQFKPTVVQPMVYANGFMVPPIYPVTATGIRPVKMELPNTEWTKTATGQGISLPYGYSAASFVSGLPVDQNLRYPFIMPGQYVAQMPYPQQLTPFGSPAAPNAAVQPHSGMIAPQQKDKKPHVKKPLNAFMLFMKEKRADVIKECTLKESAAINQILGKMWHQLDKSEQAKYYEMAREERAKHMQMYPGWSARDNYAIHKRRKKKKAKQQQQQQTTTEEDDDPRKCRARYGMERQDMWCGPCRRKKKCIRANDDDEGEEPKDAVRHDSSNDADITSKTTKSDSSIDDTPPTSSSANCSIVHVHIKTEIAT